MHDRLRDLWDFGDLDVSERRLNEQLDLETTDAGRAEVLTQLARVEGLRGEFTDGDRLIEEAVALAGDDAVALSRIDLERGRLRRSGGDPDAARPLFDSSFATAQTVGHTFIAVDAAHMAALVAPDLDGFVEWTNRGLALADTDDDAAHWFGTLYNNLGWAYYDEGAYDDALGAFEAQVAAREQFPENRQALEIARYALGKTLRTVGRSDEAVPMLEAAVGWANGEGEPDGWFHEELAEEYAALGRREDAAEQARTAIPLLERNDPSFAGDEERAARIRAIAEAG